MITARYLSFDGHSRVKLTPPRSLRFSSPDQVIVQSLSSAISFGTESKIYGGQWPKGLDLDASLAGMTDAVRYPLAYGYATLGRVIATAPQFGAKSTTKGTAAKQLEGALVFCFTPHGSHHLVKAEDLIVLPELDDPRHALFIPNLETALSLVMDAAPIMGESVAVVGLGVVGQLVTSLLARFPLDQLVALDPDDYRRDLCHSRIANSAKASAGSGSPQSFAVATADQLPELEQRFDAVIEVSGTLAGLKTATALTMPTGRVILGSLYGEDQQLSGSLPFAPHFHRSKIRLICSQVSSIDPALSGRFTKSRRMTYVLALLSDLKDQLSPLITHEIPFAKASDAYGMLAAGETDCCQVILEYDAA